MKWVTTALALLAILVYGRRRVTESAGERRFRELTDELPLFVWTHAASGAIDYANRRLCDFARVGRSRGAISPEILREIIFPADLKRVQSALPPCLKTGVPYETELRLKPAGSETADFRWALVRIVPARTAGSVRWIGVATDIHEGKLAGHERDLQLRSLAEAAPIIVWRARSDGYADYFNSRWTELTGLGSEASAGWGWTQALHADDVAAAKQTWRRALQSHQPYEIEFRLHDARNGGYRWHLVRGSPQFDSSRSGVVAWLASCTDIDDKKRSEANLRLLIDTGTQLLSSLGVQESFAALVGVLVPAYADWAAVSTVGDDGLPRIAEIRHGDVRLNARARELVGTVYGRRLGGGIAASAASGTPHVWMRIPTDWLALVPEPARTELSAFQTISAISVPIRVGHRVGAILTLGRAQNDRGFQERDLPAYCELARRIGIATKNAESYENERRVASSFQRAALPAVLPSDSVVAFDAVYEAGQSEALVGGDWYDAFLLVDGRVVVSIGDVSGSGLAAALTMSVVRQSIRAAARVQADPLSILDAADRTLRSDDPERIVTAFVGIFDPTTAEFTFAGAGHPPPLHRHADGTVEELLSSGAPLGLRRRGATGESAVVLLQAGALVVLYTDGLTEATRDVFEGERLLRAALADEAVVASPAPAHAIGRSVLRRGSGDDVAILTLSIRDSAVAPSGPLARKWTFGTGDAALSAAARREFAQALREAGVPANRADIGELVFGEVVSNAVRHGAGRVEVRLEWAGRRPVLHVLDEGPGYRYNGAHGVDELSESGRGLFLVSMLTEDFNVSPRTGGGSHSRAALACEAPATLDAIPRSR